jgi:hypothetical protein
MFKGQSAVDQDGLGLTLQETEFARPVVLDEVGALTVSAEEEPVVTAPAQADEPAESGIFQLVAAVAELGKHVRQNEAIFVCLGRRNV